MTDVFGNFEETTNTTELTKNEETRSQSNETIKKHKEKTTTKQAQMESNNMVRKTLSPESMIFCPVIKDTNKTIRVSNHLLGKKNTKHICQTRIQHVFFQAIEKI